MLFSQAADVSKSSSLVAMHHPSPYQCFLLADIAQLSSILSSLICRPQPWLKNITVLESIVINTFSFYHEIKAKSVNIYEVHHNIFDIVAFNHSFASAIPPPVIANVASLSGKSGLKNKECAFFILKKL